MAEFLPLPPSSGQATRVLGPHLGSRSPASATNRPERERRKSPYLLDFRQMSRLGLEPRTYGLKVRCSTS